MSEQIIDPKEVARLQAYKRISDQVAGNANVLRRVNNRPPEKVGWLLNLYPQAGGASGSYCKFRTKEPTPPDLKRLSPPMPHEVKEPNQRSLQESASRAKRQIRRYCAQNRLNRLITLTYEGSGCFDQHQLRDHLAEFVRNLRKEIGQDFPYCWVPEWHSAHGLHAHLAVGRYIKHSLIEKSWGRGFVHIKILGDHPHGSQSLDQARLAAGYLSKYVSKSFFDDRHIFERWRHDIAEGFIPKPIKLFAPELDEVLRNAVEQMGYPFDYSCHSNEDPNWNRPGVV